MLVRNRDVRGLENLEPDLIAKKVEEKKRFYRLDLEEAQGALVGIAEDDAAEDNSHAAAPGDLLPGATFQIELDSAWGINVTGKEEWELVVRGVIVI